MTTHHSLSVPDFDLEILLPVYPKDRYLKRLQAFQRFGFLGSHDLRVRLILLPGTCELDAELQRADAWDGISEVVVVPGPHDHPAPKVAHHYGHVMQAQALDARWYLRVDDDSLTDIDRLMRYLDATFDWRDPLHLAGTATCDILEPYTAALREVDGDRFFRDKGFCEVFHEWEASISSRATMKRILNDHRARELLHRIAQVPHGFSDQCLPLAARLCGIPLSLLSVMTTHCQLDEFAAFTPNGRGLFHIHYLSPDNPEMWARYMDKRRQFGLSTDTTKSVEEVAHHD